MKFQDVGARNIKIFVMEAIGPAEQNAILRKYDLKGSTYDRQVERQQRSIEQGEKIDKILKDTDFQNFEKSFDIDMATKKRILNSISKDVQFFGKHNIIDYSLIVIIADASKLPEEYIREETAIGNYRMIKHDSDPNILYFVGIIDYL